MDILPHIPYIAAGAWVTLKYAITSVSLGTCIGVILALCKVTPWPILRHFSSAYTSVFRGTPLLVQLSLVYYVTPSLLGMTITPFTAGVIAFSMNSGAYVSEIIRAGIQSIDKGQFEAAQSLGISYNLMMKDIILPQAVRKVLPALVNEMINLLKESAIISTIGEADLMRRAQMVAAEKYTYIEPLLVAGGCYYAMILILSYGARLVEKRINTYDLH